jgi:cystathionine beta-lyase/cystathionine gamma-synthase
MSDATVDKRLVRVSIGVEDAKDLMEDVERALSKLQGSVKE